MELLGQIPSSLQALMHPVRILLQEALTNIPSFQQRRELSIFLAHPGHKELWFIFSSVRVKNDYLICCINLVFSVFSSASGISGIAWGSFPTSISFTQQQTLIKHFLCVGRVLNIHVTELARSRELWGRRAWLREQERASQRRRYWC